MIYQLINQNLPNSLTPVEQVLINRGIKQELLQQFRFPTDDNLYPPILIKNIDKGAKLLAKHIKNNSKVFLQVDADCDGFTSAAIFLNYLNRIFPSFVQNNISYRLHTKKQHGLILETIPTEEVSLVVALDSSSSDYDVHQALFEKNIDVLVIDHHQAKKESEYACVINNQLCDYPNKALSGAGMVYKFCCYLDSLLNLKYADEFTDLATVGIEADVMNLKDLEVRTIINKGMSGFKNPLLKAMVQKDKFHFAGKELTPFNITWYISPFINAISRTGTIEEKYIVFSSMIEYLAEQTVPSTKRGSKPGDLELLIEQALRVCTNVKNRQNNIKEKTTEVVEYLIKQQNLLDNKVLVVPIPIENAVDKNLTGLIANQLLSNYNRSVILLNENIDENGIKSWSGSARGYDKSNFKNFKLIVEQSNLVEYAEGQWPITPFPFISGVAQAANEEAEQVISWEN